MTTVITTQPATERDWRKLMGDRNTPAKKRTVKQALKEQHQRLVRQMQAIDQIVSHIEKTEPPCHRLSAVLASIKRAAFDLLPVERRGVPANYIEARDWLRMFAPAADSAPVAEADLKRAALALARPNGPCEDDGVCETLEGDRVATHFNPQLLRMAHTVLLVGTPALAATAPQCADKGESNPKPKRRKPSKASVIDMQRFRDDRKGRRF